MPKTAVIYARFSCNKQREASIDDQLRVCRDWCKREGYAIVAEYCDYAISGRTDDRPEFQRMVANAGESDIVLVYMMDRFSRGEYDAPIYKRELAQHGVKLVSALEQIPDSPEGIIYEKLLEGLAACESKKTAIRTRRGMEGNALKCKTNGVRVFGYASNEADEYVIDEDEAAFVREAFKRRIAKETTNSIARDFAARGVKTSQGNPCGYSMVERMVKNRKYTGRYEWGGVVKEGGMPAIIDEVTFMEAQGIRAAKERSAESWGDFALSGKAICAGCGRNLQGVSGRGRGNRKYEYYRCHDGCVKPVRREELEGEIVKALRALLQDREEALRIARMVAESSDGAEVAARRKQAAQSLSAAERGLKNILNAIEQGIIAPGAKERIAELEHQRDRAKLDLEPIRDDQIDPERLAGFLQCGSALDDATLLKAFVYQASVSDEECIVTLNYDVENNEPARLDIQRVRTKCKWCPHGLPGARGGGKHDEQQDYRRHKRAAPAVAVFVGRAWVRHRLHLLCVLLAGGGFHGDPALVAGTARIAAPNVAVGRCERAIERHSLPAMVGCDGRVAGASTGAHVQGIDADAVRSRRVAGLRLRGADAHEVVVRVVASRGLADGDVASMTAVAGVASPHVAVRDAIPVIEVDCLALAVGGYHGA